MPTPRASRTIIRAWRAADLIQQAMGAPSRAEALFVEPPAVRRCRLIRQLRQERFLGLQGRPGYDLARHLRLLRALAAPGP